MIKYFLAAALICMSANAMADRVVSGSNEKVENSDGSRTEACRAAKDSVLEKKANDELVAKFSECDCKQNEKGSWACSVEVTFKNAR